MGRILYDNNRQSRPILSESIQTWPTASVELSRLRNIRSVVRLTGTPNGHRPRNYGFWSPYVSARPTVILGIARLSKPSETDVNSLTHELVVPRYGLPSSHRTNTSRGIQNPRVINVGNAGNGDFRGPPI